MTNHLSAPTGEFLERAEAFWTPEREAKVAGKKNWPIKPSNAAGLLRVLGLLNADVSMPADAVRKVSQINHMVTLLLPQLEDLAKRHEPVRILDACCGTSSLAMIVAWLFQQRFAKRALVVGIDSNEAVIATSQRRAAALGLEPTTKFLRADVATARWEEAFAGLFPDETPGRPHLVVALHACDTATDQVAALGLHAQADVIALAPCCHAELARQWKDLGDGPDHPFSPIFRSPNLRRETAAQLTDALRLLLLRGHGYEVTATEFVPSAHTPKNRLLLCIRRGRFHAESQAQFTALKASLGGSTITLETLCATVAP